MYDVYTIKEGDTIESISNRYNITPYVLYQLNGFLPEFVFEVGKNIIVPKSSSIYFDYYTIKKGDSLYKIASKYGVEYSLLAFINGIETDDYIYPNQVIAVPKNGVKYYVVKEGDTIGNISNNFGVDVLEIINQNQDLILLPEQLVVYRA